MPRKSVAVVGIGVGLEDILKKNQREKSKIVGTHDENMPDIIPIKTIQSSTK